VVRATYAALNQSGLDAFAENWADDVEWQTMRDRWRGRHAGRTYLQELVDLFDDFTTEQLGAALSGTPGVAFGRTRE